MSRQRGPGGVIHTYQRYDPGQFPSPTSPPPDMVSGAFEHMLAWGNRRRLSEEELARAIRIDPSQISGLGPSLEALRRLLEERKAKILATYEIEPALQETSEQCDRGAESVRLPAAERRFFDTAIQERQLYDLERLWYRLDRETHPAAGRLVSLIESLGVFYQIEELVARYEFTGTETVTPEQAIEIKQELERIEQLLKQLEEAEKNGQIYLIDTEALAEFVEEADLDELEGLQQKVADYLRQAAEEQGLDNRAGKIELSPEAYRIFQSKLLERIFSKLEPSRTGRHQTNVAGEGSVELQSTCPYTFGDSVTQMDIPQSFTNAILRSRSRNEPLRLSGEDIVVHRTRNTPKCATAVIMDMSGSMRYEGQYINVKKMALALQGLITREYPGDWLAFFEMFTHAAPCRPNQIIDLLPKPVTITDPVVRYRIDMSRPEISEVQLPPHFTNIQHALQLARLNLANRDTPNRQIVLITDGLPTAHYEGEWLYLLYPPDLLTEEATLREALLCKQAGITINFFLIPSWSQSEEDIRFAYRVAESTQGRVFFTAGSDLDRFVVWDYLERKREILG